MTKEMHSSPRSPRHEASVSACHDSASLHGMTTGKERAYWLVPRFPTMSLTMIDFLEAARAAIAALGTQRIMGLDLGDKTIGIATSDLTLSIATPRHTIERTKFQADAKALLDFAAKEDIGLLVLGLPLNMDGTEGPRCQSTRAFARNLSKLTTLPLIYWDERLSTAAVTRTMLEADMSRAKRDKNVDKLAAAFILQGLLDMR